MAQNLIMYISENELKFYRLSREIKKKKTRIFLPPPPHFTQIYFHYQTSAIRLQFGNVGFFTGSARPHCISIWKLNVYKLVTGSHTVEAYSSCERTMDLQHLAISSFGQLERKISAKKGCSLWPFLSAHQCSFSRTVYCLW